MHYRSLGSNGPNVSAVGMGALPLSVHRDRPSEADSISVIHHAIDCGVTLIDTADSYCIDDTETGHNERVIGKALDQLGPSRRQGVVVATKGGFVRPQGRWDALGTAEHLRQACEQSLTYLGVDAIYLYQYHCVDPQVPLEESITQLSRLKDEGKIRQVGVSNFSVAQLQQARGIVEIASVQNRFSRRDRSPETDGVLEHTQQNGIALIPYSPLNGMSGAKTLGEGDQVVQEIAADHGASVYQVVLAWLLSKGPMVLPIPGSSRKETIEDSAGAADLTLTAEEINQLDGS